MGRNKKVRYADISANELVLEPGKELFDQIKGNWNKEYFKNDKEIIVEFACGKGEYTTGLAQQYPDKNFVGVDIKGGRLWNGCKEVVEHNLSNVAFLRTDILKIGDLFEAGEVSEIWITFPDPRPKERDEKKRLTSDRFLSLYTQILKEGGSLNLKTDNAELFDYSLNKAHEHKWKIVHATKMLYRSPLYTSELKIKTTYERKFNDLGFEINYLKIEK